MRDAAVATNRCRKVVAVVAWAFAVGMVLSLSAPAEAGGADSQRLARAKDYIADEQWARAVDELRAALQDPKEPAPDEARFWLAHSLYHLGRTAEALQTIDALEERHPKSRWVSPARSLRIEIAYNLRREDMLWRFVAPAPPAPPTPQAPPKSPRPSAAPAAPAPPAPPAPAAPAAAPAPPAPPAVISDMDLRIQALSSLMRSHAEQVIPILKEMVYEVKTTEEARRALFVLARSDRPEARATVIEVARKGPESIRIAAVREMSYVGWPDVNQELLVVYSDGTPGVRHQVVRTLGQRGSAEALAEIARKEADRELRDSAIIMIGRAGGRIQLRMLYDSARPDVKEPIIAAFFNAGADEDLIRVAKQDADETMRRLAIDRLRLLDTDKARAFLASLK